MSQNSDLTVVIPVRDGAPFIADAVASVLGQRGGAPRIVVVDDGSSDGSADIVRAMAPSLDILRTSGTGPAAARNRGVAATETPFVAFCDADDVWPAERCRSDLEFLDAHPDAPGVLGRVRFQAESPTLLSHFRFPGREPVAAFWHLGALTVRRTTWLQVGALDETLTSFEDHDWLLRANEAGLAPERSDGVALTCRVRVESATSAGRVVPARERLAVLHRAASRRWGTPPETGDRR